MLALRYVDLNPVRAGLVKSALEWKWSSAKAHVEPASHDPLLDFGWMGWCRTWNYSEWKQILEAASPASEEWNSLRRSTHTGEPMGAPDFLLHLEKQAGRRLRIGTPGRPLKRGQTPISPSSHFLNAGH
jgi:putative transposase